MRRYDVECQSMCKYNVGCQNMRRYDVGWQSICKYDVGCQNVCKYDVGCQHMRRYDVGCQSMCKYDVGCQKMRRYDVGCQNMCKYSWRCKTCGHTSHKFAKHVHIWHILWHPPYIVAAKIWGQQNVGNKSFSNVSATLYLLYKITTELTFWEMCCNLAANIWGKQNVQPALPLPQQVSLYVHICMSSWASHITQIKESRNTYKWVIPYTCLAASDALSRMSSSSASLWHCSSSFAAFTFTCVRVRCSVCCSCSVCVAAAHLLCSL